jgi:glutamine synthetase
MLNSGLDGVKNKMAPPPATDANIYAMTPNQMRRAKIQSLPGSLLDAMTELKKSKYAKETLGEHILEKYLANKEIEWDKYRIAVTDWEIENYLNVY